MGENCVEDGRKQEGFPCDFCSQIEHTMTVDGPICSMIPTGIIRQDG
jgi:hypothetical protein